MDEAGDCSPYDGTVSTAGGGEGGSAVTHC